MTNNGYLEIAIGPMFSGKTEWIQTKYNMFKNLNKVLVINHYLDTRYSENEVVSHSGVKIPCIRVKQLESLLNNKELIVEDYDIILINEAQFFEDLVLFVKNMLNKNKNIYVSGLDGDFQQNKFGHILDLIPLSDSVTKLKANCMNCKNENCAIFSHRINKNNNQTLIGSEESYIATCRKCYNILTTK